MFFSDNFTANMEINLTRQGLLDVLSKAGYSFPVSDKAILTVEVSTPVERDNLPRPPDRIVMTDKSEINIRLETDKL